MNVAEKIEFFSKMALKEAQDKRAQLLPEIHKEYMAACEKMISEANKKYEKTIQEEAYKAEQMKNREILQANTEAKRSLIELRTQLINDLFGNVFEMLIDFVKTEEYLELLVKNIAETASKYSQGITVSICERDAAVKNRIEGMAGVELVMAKDEMIGGFTAQIKGKNIFIDNSYRTKLAETRDSFNKFKITT